MEFLRVKEIKVCCLLEQFVSRYRLLSLAFFFTFLALMLPFPRLCLQIKQGIFVRDCKVRHSVTKPYRITVGNIIYV